MQENESKSLMPASLNELFNQLKITRERQLTLQREETRLLKQIQEQTRRLQNQPTGNQRNKLIGKGDAVIITNRVRGKNGAMPLAADKRGRVTEITDGPQIKVHILTDSGRKTWRLPKNLRKA